MKNTTLHVAAFLLFILLFITFSNLNAQSPGQIVRPVGGAGVTVLNPDGNGYSSANLNSTIGFTTDDIAQSEVPYKIVPPAITEPTGDLATGPSGGFTDIVKTVDGSGFYIYTNGTNLYFRLRIGGIISGSKGYSVLIDTDNKMGNSGVNADPGYIAPSNNNPGNPGFEYEVVLQTNFNVTVYNVDGVGNPVALTPTYTLNSNSQISVALSTDGNNPDYFYDWYVPLAAIGNPTSIRLAATTVTSPTSALQGSRSDIYGVDDSKYSSAASAWTSVVNAQPSISITNFSSLGTSIGATCTAAPTINSPITTGTNVAVTGAWTQMDATKGSTATVTLYKNGTALGTTATVSTGGTWSITVPSVATGEVYYAKAVAAGESQCLQSDNVTAGCSSYPAAPTIVCASTKGMQGTIALGTTVNIYELTTSNISTTATPLTTGLLYVNNTTDRTFNYYGSNTQSGSACQGQQSVFTNTNPTVMFVTNNGGCLSTPVIGCVTGNNTNSTITAPATNTLAITTPVYPYQTTVSGTGTVTNGQVFRLFVNDVYTTGYTVATSGSTFSFSGLTLKTGDVLKVYVQTSGSCMTVSPSATVVCYNDPPAITTTSSGQLLATATSISGTSAANASITLKRTSPATTWTTTANSSGAWTVTGLTLASAETYTATATSTTCATPSQASATATVAAVTTTCPTITGTYTDNNPSVTGSITTSATGTVRLYLDGVLEGSVAVGTTGASPWTIPSLNYALYNGGVLSVTFQSGTNAESTGCTTSTVTCSSPLPPTISPTTSTITTGGTVSYIISNTTSGAWYAISDNTTGVSYGTSTYNTSTSSLTLATNAFSNAGSYTVKISADKLTGCAATYKTASITVNNSVLAVRFLVITAKKQTDGIAVKWTVADEQNINYYEVERSYNGWNFEPVGRVPYATSANSDYHFLDKAYNNGNTIYYRVRQVDVAGNNIYSFVTSLKTATATTIQVVPNPAQSHATVNISSVERTNGWLELLDLNGKQLFQKAITLHPGNNSFEVNNLNAFAHVVYVMKVRTETSSYYQKLLIE